MKTTITVFFACLALSCTKTATELEQDQLPPITQNGTNKAGFLLNGKTVIPKNASQAIGGPLIYGLKYHLGINFGNPSFDDYFAINIKNRKDIDGDEIYIHLNNMMLGAGTYQLGQSNGNYFTASPANNHVVLKKAINSGSIITYLSNSNSGFITITRFDYPNKIISGTFNMTLYNPDNSIETVKITDGRFDINLVTLNN